MPSAAPPPPCPPPLSFARNSFPFVEKGFAELPVSLSLAPLAVPPTARPRARACFLLVLPRSGPCCRTLSSLLHPPRRPLAPGRRSGSGRDSYESGISSHDSLRPPPPSPAPPGPQPPPGPACCPPPCRCPPLPALPGAVLLSLPAAAPPSLSLAQWSAAPLPSSRPPCTGRCPASMLFLSGGGNGGTSSCSPRGSRVARCLLRWRGGGETGGGRTGEGTKGAGGACTGSGTVSVPVCRVFLTRVVHRVPPTPAPPLSPLLCDGDASYWSPDPVALSTAFPNAPTDAL